MNEGTDGDPQTDVDALLELAAEDAERVNWTLAAAGELTDALREEGHRRVLSRFYCVSSRLVLVGVTALAVPAVLYRRPVMALFGPAFAENAWLLPGFVLAQFGACAAGSVGILLMMTDNQRPVLVVNTAITLILAVVAVPLTVEYGLAGLVASHLLVLSLNNGLEVAVLYHVEGLQPFTHAHLRPLVAGLPFAAVALRFEPAERKLVGTLAARYRGSFTRAV